MLCHDVKKFLLLGVEGGTHPVAHATTNVATLVTTRNAVLEKDTMNRKLENHASNGVSIGLETELNG